MRTEHYLFNVLGVASESRTKLVDGKKVFPLAPVSLLLTVLRW